MQNTHAYYINKLCTIITVKVFRTFANPKHFFSRQNENMKLYSCQWSQPKP